MKEFRWFLYAFLVLWVLWLLTGGATRYENRTRPFLEQPAPIEGWQPYTLDELKNR